MLAEPRQLPLLSSKECLQCLQESSLLSLGVALGLLGPGLGWGTGGVCRQARVLVVRRCWALGCKSLVVIVQKRGARRKGTIGRRVVWLLQKSKWRTRDVRHAQGEGEGEGEGDETALIAVCHVLLASLFTGQVVQAVEDGIRNAVSKQASE